MTDNWRLKAHLQPVQGSRAALSPLRPVYTECRPGIPIDRDHPFRPIATGLLTGVRAPSHDPGIRCKRDERDYLCAKWATCFDCLLLACSDWRWRKSCTALRAASSNEISALAHAADAERVIDIRNDTLIKIERAAPGDESATTTACSHALGLRLDLQITRSSGLNMEALCASAVSS